MGHPDYLVIGHVTRDILPDGLGVALGGTATYSALAAQRLGLQAAVVTACAPEDTSLLDALSKEGVWVHALPSQATTSFHNSYDSEGKRTQVTSAQARTLFYDDVPMAWRSVPIAHLGPVVRELPDDLPSQFVDGLLGITPQGWLRGWDVEGRVSRIAWPVPLALTSLPTNAFLVLSTEDLDFNPQLVDTYSRLAPCVAITQGAGDALLYAGDECIVVPACPASPVDLTGAGDVFATALLVRYSECRDLREATQFAHAAAACGIEGVGIAAIPFRGEVEARVRLGV